MKRWLRKEIEETKTVAQEVRITRAAQRDLLHEVADVVLGLQAATEKLQMALVQYVSKYGMGDEEEEDDGDGT
jgi:hypothetical protein